MTHSEMVRSPVGTAHWIEHGSIAARRRSHRAISAECVRYGAKVKYESYNAFSSLTNEPNYILKVTVVRSGRQLEKRGRR